VRVGVSEDVLAQLLDRGRGSTGRYVISSDRGAPGAIPAYEAR